MQPPDASLSTRGRAATDSRTPGSAASAKRPREHAPAARRASTVLGFSTLEGLSRRIAVIG